MTVIRNVKTLVNNELEETTVVIDGDVITQVFTDNDFTANSKDSIIDGGGQLLIPGMVDVHIHGANNYNMMDGTTRSIQEVSKACAKTGCTSFLVTSVSSTLEDLLQMIRQTKKVVGKEEGAKIAGIHLEGPYLNIEKMGMQNPKFLKYPDLNEMTEIFREAEGLIKMMTIAPELPGGLDLIEF